MDKLTMAHEMALKIAESGVSVDICAGLGWRYADAMQAEADKRASQKRAELRELLNHPNTFIEKEGRRTRRRNGMDKFEAVVVCLICMAIGVFLGWLIGK